MDGFIWGKIWNCIKLKEGFFEKLSCKLLVILHLFITVIQLYLYCARCSLYGSKNYLLVICLVGPAYYKYVCLLENKSEYSKPLGLMVLALAFLSFP